MDIFFLLQQLLFFFCFFVNSFWGDSKCIIHQSKRCSVVRSERVYMFMNGNRRTGDCLMLPEATQFHKRTIHTYTNQAQLKCIEMYLCQIVSIHKSYNLWQLNAIIMWNLNCKYEIISWNKAERTTGYLTDAENSVYIFFCPVDTHKMACFPIKFPHLSFCYVYIRNKYILYVIFFKKTCCWYQFCFIFSIGVSFAFGKILFSWAKNKIYKTQLEKCSRISNNNFYSVNPLIDIEAHTVNNKNFVEFLWLYDNFKQSICTVNNEIQ